MTVTPVIYTIIAKPQARDGDSMYLIREREIGRDDERLIFERDIKRVLCRAAWLACPEISGPNRDPVNGPRATRDAQTWYDLWYAGPGALEAWTYGREKYGRPLVDIRVVGLDVPSFSQFMLSPDANSGRGWDPYLGGVR